MAVNDAYVFLGFLTPVLIQLFFPKPPTTFLTRFCIGERRKYAGKKSRLNRGSNSKPPGHESDTLSTEPPRRGVTNLNKQILVIPSIHFRHDESISPIEMKNDHIVLHADDRNPTQIRQ